MSSVTLDEAMLKPSTAPKPGAPKPDAGKGKGFPKGYRVPKVSMSSVNELLFAWVHISWAWFDHEVSITIICKQNTPKTVEDGGGEASTSSTSVAESGSVQSVNDGAIIKRADRGKNRGGPFRGGFIRGAGRGGSSRGGSSQNADSRRGNFRGNSRVSFNWVKTLRPNSVKERKVGSNSAICCFRVIATFPHSQTTPP